MPKLKLNHQNLSNWVQYVMKTKEDNDVIGSTSAVYAKNETKLSWPIRPSAIYDKNQIEQQCYQSNRWSLHWKWY